jgi:glycerate kinase
VSPRTRAPAGASHPGHAAIPSTLLLASGSFGARLSSASVLAALARGLRAGGRADHDLCPLPDAREHGEDVRKLLDALELDARVHRARAVIIGAQRLHESSLARSMTFEIATRARQRGVPAYAVTRENALASFDARMLDLQLILEARSARGLEASGRTLAQLL